ncbi:23S rRNA pseudouridine(2605) synthase RluB [Motiliproteus sp. SC1-56]|uniref:23S rRNA pseudouridine(2605) synthase RluB n=1 Tax=Motiliproteus sp. SC1-56 TaxID=2799565 RepID=UPI001A8EFE64|nr:23S rRNA pseudouridine(2605) synthase RluB [Motiliproteus sp. SC1-56]
MNDEKLHKVLARAGLGSRREMERWIESGRVQVNGERASLGDRVTPADVIKVDGQRVSLGAEAGKGCRVIVYNKPVGEVCTRHDPEGRPTVFEKLPKLKSGRWISVGRLDINTSGLLLFTTDGELANKLMHPSTGIDREYAVRVHGEVSDETLQKLKEGVFLEDGMARFTDVQLFDGTGSNVWYHVVLMEGKNREVRRLWESQGVEVSRLKRVRYGCIFMPKSIASGQWLELSQKELNDLCDLAGLERRKVVQKTPEQAKADKRRQKRARPVRER